MTTHSLQASEALKAPPHPHWWHGTTPSAYVVVSQRTVCTRCYHRNSSAGTLADAPSHFTSSEIFVSYTHPERPDVRVSRPMLDGELETPFLPLPIYRRELAARSVPFCFRCVSVSDAEPPLKRRVFIRPESGNLDDSGREKRPARPARPRPRPAFNLLDPALLDDLLQDD